MIDRATYDRFWDGSVIRQLHPTQLLILEAVARLGLPVSASVMVHVSSGTIPLARCSYHLRQLAARNLLVVAAAGQKRNATEEAFYLRPARAE